MAYTAILAERELANNMEAASTLPTRTMPFITEPTAIYLEAEVAFIMVYSPIYLEQELANNTVATSVSAIPEMLFITEIIMTSRELEQEINSEVVSISTILDPEFTTAISPT